METNTPVQDTELEKMSPAELNVEFLEMLDQIPTQESEEQVDQTLWLQNLQTLLNYSLITRSFKRFIMGDLTEQIESRQRTIKPWRQFYWPEIEEGGIFDQIRAMELDRNAYRYIFDEYTTVLEAVNKKNVPISALSEPDMMQKQVVLKAWRQEFIDKYNEEP